MLAILYVLLMMVFETEAASQSGNTFKTSLREFTGTCDASAAIAINADRFVLADDESNVLRIYSLQAPGPSKTFDISSYLRNNPDNREADIEGAAKLGNTIYWITSHGRNKKAEVAPNRMQFFAAKVSVTDNSVLISQEGASYTNLLRDLVADKKLQTYGFEKAAMLAPKEPGALNIEGLAASKDGQIVWIGFRNPVPNGKSLLLQLKNPADLVTGKSSARFGEPTELDLGGLGIREIQYWAEKDVYLIAAGPQGEEGEFRIYEWSGAPDRPAKELTGIDFMGIRPEGIVLLPGSDSRFLLISDDGATVTNGKECKDNEESQQKFGGLLVEFVKP